MLLTLETVMLLGAVRDRRRIIMLHPRVEGTYYKMGYNYGTIIYKHGFRMPNQPTEKLDFGRTSEAEVRRIFPEILDEIQGLADACHASEENSSSLILGVGAFKFEPTCSAFAVSTGSDVVFGRNYDFFYSLKKYTESYLTCPTTGFWSLGHSDIFVGREDGLNEKGLAVAMTGVAGKAVKPGVSFVIAIRCLLDKCGTVAEGVRLLSSMHFSSNSNYLLADREGALAVVEASSAKVKVRTPEDDSNCIVCTNHFVHPEMQDMENPKERTVSNWDSIPRYDTILDAIKQRRPRTTVETAREILSNHEGYVCSHQNEIKLGTLWSIIATLRKPQILRAEGHPCRTRYKEDRRLRKALQERG